jgi:hypothetical protein
MAEVHTLCYICGLPAEHVCRLCGKHVCGLHYDKNLNLCTACKRGKQY